METDFIIYLLFSIWHNIFLQKLVVEALPCKPVNVHGRYKIPHIKGVTNRTYQNFDKNQLNKWINTASNSDWQNNCVKPLLADVTCRPWTQLLGQLFKKLSFSCYLDIRWPKGLIYYFTKEPRKQPKDYYKTNTKPVSPWSSHVVNCPARNKKIESHAIAIGDK